MKESLRVPLYERLPEIYRTKDKELRDSPEQLKAFLSLVEEAFGHIHENIEELYHDLFIETADDWVIPYIGDLLGTSYLFRAIPGHCAQTWPTPSLYVVAKAPSGPLNCSHTISPAGARTA